MSLTLAIFPLLPFVCSVEVYLFGLLTVLLSVEPTPLQDILDLPTPYCAESALNSEHPVQTRADTHGAIFHSRQVGLDQMQTHPHTLKRLHIKENNLNAPTDLTNVLIEGGNEIYWPQVKGLPIACLLTLKQEKHTLF